MANQSSATDLELGCGPGFSIVDKIANCNVRWPWGNFRDKKWCSCFPARVKKGDEESNPNRLQIEDYPNGYPRFAALMAADSSFQIFRRFSALRTRLLLLSQDHISQLEEKLNTIDSAEASPLFLASRRRDRNEERRTVISELQGALRDYDGLIERNLRISSFDSAHRKDIASLRSWIMKNAAISRAEIKFLDRNEDLLCLSDSKDGFLSWLERAIFEGLLSLNIKSRSDITRDRYVHIYSPRSTTLLARTVLTPLIVIILLAPVIICNSVSNANARLGIIVAATGLFLTVLSLLTRGKMLELVVAGAT
ncbi:hypothetical protein ABW19_dt0204734 [Dactylella cylindrospora]|nr:hypothetical protein ABW19_dt0204734 [Dactylella cylindrospora]